MQAYKIETTITEDGKITLPKKYSKIFNHKVEILVLDKESNQVKKIKEIPSYSCGGKIKDFSREELYEPRL